MTPLRVALLGCGGVAARHAAAVAAHPHELQLVACTARRFDRAQEFAARVGTKAFGDLDALLAATHPDLLIVALPPDAHAGQVEAAAAAGVHLLVEKPIALELSRAQSMLEAVRRAEVVAACGFMYRFGAAVQAWNDASARGATGRPGLFTAHFHCNALHADWWRERRRSGGQMFEQLIHLIDLARHHLGMPQTVYARAATFFHRDTARYDADDVSALVLGYDDGRIATLNATNGAVPGRWDKGWTIVAERMTGHFANWNAATLTVTSPVSEPLPTQRIESATDPFASQLLDMREAIVGARPPRVPLHEGELALRILLAARRSIEQRCEVRLS